MFKDIPIFIFVQCVAMVLVTFINIAVAQIRVVANLEREDRRLRLALQAELSEMLWINSANLRNLRSKRPYILSSRACTAVYKANLSRIISIVDSEIALLVRAYAVNEQVEHLVAATTKPSGPMAFRIVEGETPIDEVVDEIERSSGFIRETIDAMNVGERKSSPGFSLFALFPRPVTRKRGVWPALAARFGRAIATPAPR